MNIGKVLSFAVGAMMVFGLTAAPVFAQRAPMTEKEYPAKVQPGSGAGAMMGNEFMGNHRGSQIMNKTVKNDREQTLGTVKDIVLDTDGDLTYVVVSAAGEPNKLFPIPFDPSMVKFQDNAVVVSHLDKSKLDKAPAITSNEWNKLQDPAFESRVHGYYRLGAEGGAAGTQDSMNKTAPGAEKKY